MSQISDATGQIIATWDTPETIITNKHEEDDLLVVLEAPSADGVNGQV